MTAAYATVVAIGAALSIALLLAEPERLQPKHRRPRPTTSEVLDMFRQILYTTGAVLGVLVIAVPLSVGLIRERLERRERRREMRVWDGQAVHS